MKAEDWRRGHENVFPVRHALRHFLRTRMPQLRARGLVLETSNGLFLHQARLDACLIQLLKAPAGADEQGGGGQLAGFVKAGAYQASHTNVFPTMHSFRHFLRSRRSELRARSLVLETTAGTFVHEQRLDACLLDLLTSARWLQGPQKEQEARA